MDADVARWSVEFLSRKSKDFPFARTLIRKMVGTLPFPLSRESFLNKKYVIIDVLQEEVENASVSEHTLQTLELLEEFYRLFCFPIPATMPPAYCAVAVECTLKYLILEPSPSKNRAYLSAVDRIWRGRVRLMKRSSSSAGSEMFTPELIRWSHDIESSLRDDPQVMERLRMVDSRREAIQKVKAFLKEASDETSPSFLEFVASLPNLGEEVVPIALPSHSTHHEMELSTSDMNCEHRVKDQSTDAQAENQIPDAQIEDHIANAQIEDQIANAPIEIQRTDAPNENVENQRTNVPNKNVENQRTDAPNENDENQRTDAPNENVEDQRTDAPNENRSVDVDSREQHVCLNINNNDVDDHTKTTTSHKSNVNRPSLMVRNNTAHTYEWDSLAQGEESIAGLQGGTSTHPSKFHLASPKRKQMSPLKNCEPAQVMKRRKPKKWSELEEETLRTAVERFGEGNWKMILEAHTEIFADRTQVDLKDKWRNLTRYGTK